MATVWPEAQQTNYCRSSSVTISCFLPVGVCQTRQSVCRYTLQFSFRQESGERTMQWQSLCAWIWSTAANRIQFFQKKNWFLGTGTRHMRVPGPQWLRILLSRLAGLTDRAAARAVKAARLFTHVHVLLSVQSGALRTAQSPPANLRQTRSRFTCPPDLGCQSVASLRFHKLSWSCIVINPPLKPAYRKSRWPNRWVGFQWL